MLTATLMPIFDIIIVLVGDVLHDKAEGVGGIDDGIGGNEEGEDNTNIAGYSLGIVEEVCTLLFSVVSRVCKANVVRRYSFTMPRQLLKFSSGSHVFESYG